MDKKKYHLTNDQKKEIEKILKCELLRQPDIIFAYLHGSFLLPVPCGDVDVAVYLAEKALQPEHWVYEAKLAMQLDRLTGIPVDILTLNYAPVTVRYHVTRGRLLFSKDEKLRFTFLEETWREYFDFQPFLHAFYRDLW